MIFDLQVAIVELLRNDAGVAALTGARVYDEVPQDLKGIKFPFQAWGDDDAEANDDKSGDGFDVRFRLHTWSRYAGKAETKRIHLATWSALHHKPGRLHVSGWQVVELDFLRDNIVLDADGRTRHGVAEYRALLHKIQA